MPRRLFSELKRRNVWRAAALYAAGAWLVVQVATQVFPFLDIPNGVVRGIIVAALVGFPFWIALAWFYELTPEGLRRESEVDPDDSGARRTGKRLDRWIIAVLSLAVVLLLTEMFLGHRGTANATEIASAPARSVAVLPFVNESSDAEQGYFADGIAEDLLDLLARLPALRVAARTSSFAFKGKDVPVDSIARTLRVANVLEGSVRRAGEQLRISARLVRAADGYEVWSQTWDRKPGDVFRVQDEIAREVAAQLRIQLLGGAAPAARQTDPRAYALFLQARELAFRGTRETLLRSDSLLRQALTIDPRYVPAWNELARNYGSESIVGVLPFAEGLKRDREAANRALAIDPNYAAGYVRIGWIGVADGDLPDAARQLQRALALDPTNLDALRNSCLLLENLGRLPEAIALGEYVAARDPVNTTALHHLATYYITAGRYDQGIALMRTVEGLSPDYFDAPFLLGLAMAGKGQTAAGVAEMQKEPVELLRLVGLAVIYHSMGRHAESDAALAELTRKHASDGAYNIAGVHAFRGEADLAFAWLEKAVQQQDPGVLQIVTDKPLFDPIRADPRWLPFLRRIGRAPEQLARISFHPSPPPTTTPASGTE